MRSKLYLIPLIALAAAALACGGGSTGNGGSSGGGGDAGPKVLYQDDFSDSNSGWGTGTDSTSSLEYTNGQYVFQIYETAWLIWGTASEENFSNVHIEVTAKNTGSADDPTYGIICNYQDDKNFYYMGIGSDGYYAIARYVDDDLTIMSDDDGQDEWLFSEDLPINAASYKLGADCGNGRLALYVDGKQVVSVSDSSFSSGQIGLFVRSFDKTDVEVKFDNFVVTELR